MTRQERKDLAAKRQKAWIGVAGLSAPSKMPCFGYSIPASKCKLGSILTKIAGTTCFKCYAKKGRYAFKNVVECLERRYNAVMHSETWIEDMVTVIEWKVKNGYFRFHDAGDVQNVKHLGQIAEIARRLPLIKFWLPTREAGIVKEFLESNTCPDNLTIRLSATKIDSPAVDIGLVTSGVASNKDLATCPAPKQGNECKDCRACWSKEVKHVIYKAH